jgi:gliding motility-associated-like protein
MIKNLLFLLLLIRAIDTYAQGGDNCAAALANPSTVPFTYTNQSTCSATNDYSSSGINTPCLDTSYYQGKDWFYYFCATLSGFVEINVNNITPIPASVTNYETSLSVLSACPNTTTSACLAAGKSGTFNGGPNISILVPVVAGQCYYILLDCKIGPPGFPILPPYCYNYNISANFLPPSPIQPSCTNMDFETGNLNGWFTTTGKIIEACNTCPVPLYVASNFGTTLTSHKIMTGGVDPLGGFPRVAPGGNYSLRLGDSSLTGGKGASIIQKFVVAPINSSFVYRYAVVFQNPSHSAEEQPFFSAKILDQNGNLITCSDFQVAAAGNIPGFLNSPYPNVKYKEWTDVTVDLSPYVGQVVSVEFTTGDCAPGGHYGYAYIDASCSPPELNKKDSLCFGDSLKLVGPLGFKTYLWTPGNFTTKDITVSPTTNTIYTLNAVGFNNCTVTYNDTIVVVSKPVFSVVNPVTLANCNVPLTLNFSSSSPGVTVNWNGPGIVSGGNTFTPSVNIPGTYNVFISRGPCKDTSAVIVTPGIAFPNAEAGPTKALTCTSNSLILNGSSITPSTTVSWTGPGIVSGGATFTPTINAPGIYTMVVTNATNCSNSDTVIVLPRPPLPDANAGADKTFDCITNTLNLNGSSTTVGATITWTGPAIISGSSTLTPSINLPGQYILSVSLPNGCEKKDTVIVGPKPILPNANAGADKKMDCNASTLVLAGASTTANTSPMWTGPGIVFGGSSFTPTINLPGQYVITVAFTNQSSCFKKDTVVILPADLRPIASLITTKQPDCVDTTGSVQIDVLTPKGPYSITGDASLIDSIFPINITSVQPGNSIYIITDSVGCKDTVSANINTVPIASTVASSLATQQPNCNVNTGQIQLIISSGLGPFNISGSATFANVPSSTLMLNAQTPGPKVFIIEDNLGCKTKLYDTIKNVPAPIIANIASIVQPTCTNASGTVNINLSSGVGPYQISGSVTNTLTTYPFSFAGQAPGLNTYYIIDANLCKDTISASVNPAPSIPNANISVLQQPTCIIIKGTIQINVNNSSGPYTISGDTAMLSLGSPINIPNQSIGTKEYIITNSSGCSDTVNTVINAQPANSTVASSLETQQPNCAVNTGQIQLTITSGPAPFNITGSATLTNVPSSTLTLNAQTPGPKIFIIEDNLGCKTTLFDTIKNVPAPILASITSITQPTCLVQTGTVNLNLNSGLAPFVISGSATNSFTSYPFSLSGQAPGPKTYYIIDANFCKDTIIAAINPAPIIPNANISVIQQPTCNDPNGTIQINVNNSPGPYTVAGDAAVISLSNPINIPNQSSGPKSYSVTISSGCSTTVNTAINQAPLVPNANAGLPKTLTCNNPSVTLLGSSLTPNGTPSWSGPGILSGANTFTPSVNLPGTYSLAVSKNGCTDTSIVQVVLASKPSAINTNNSKAICNNNNIGSITINAVNGGVGPYNFTLNGANITNTLPQTISNLSGGNYNIVLTDINGCVLNKSIAIPNVNSPVAISSITNDVSCPKGKNGSINVQAQGSSPIKYIWSPSNIGTVLQSNVSNLSAGQYNLTLLDTNNCTTPLNFYIGQPPLIQTTISSITPFCKNNIIKLNAQSAGGSGSNYSYIWKLGTNTLATGNALNYQFNNNSTLTIITKDGKACIDTSYKIITLQSPTINTTLPNSRLCAPNCVSLTSNQNYQNTNWYFGDGNIGKGNVAKHCYQTPGIYSVTINVVDTFGCENSKTFENIIEVLEQPKIKILADPIVTPISSPEITFNGINNNGTTIQQWSWEFQDAPNGSSTSQNPKYTFKQPGLHNVVLIATNTFGCKDTSTIEVNLEYVFKFHAANAFTPDGDVNNNIWLPKGIGIDKSKYQLQVYSKWGQKLFESNDMDAGWDGKVDGKLVNEDNYIWQVKLTDLNGKDHLISGNMVVMH